MTPAWHHTPGRFTLRANGKDLAEVIRNGVQWRGYIGGLEVSAAKGWEANCVKVARMLAQ